MLPADLEGTCEGRTPTDNQTVRTVFIVGPDKKVKLQLAYPMTTGRNFDEVLRVIDSLQLTAKHNFNARELEAGRRRDHRRIGVGRGREENVSGRMEGAKALPAHRSAARQGEGRIDPDAPQARPPEAEWGVGGPRERRRKGVRGTKSPG
jgi:hypothetical protein